MFDAALDYLKTPDEILFAITMLMAVLMMFKGMREVMMGIIQLGSLLSAHCCMRFAASLVARKLDWCNSRANRHGCCAIFVRLSRLCWYRLSTSPLWSEGLQSNVSFKAVPGDQGLKDCLKVRRARNE